MFGKVPFCTVSQPTCMRKWRLTRHHRLSTLICRSERGDSYIEHTSSMVCSKPWKNSLDETFLTQEIQQTLRNVDPEAESRYSLMKLDKGLIEFVEDNSERQRTYYASANVCFPHLYLNGEISPLDFGSHTLARDVLQKQTLFAQKCVIVHTMQKTAFI